MASQTKAQQALKRKVKRVQESLRFIGLLGRNGATSAQRGGYSRSKCGGGYRVNRRGGQHNYSDRDE